MIAFTATPQVERLMKVAQECGLSQELSRGLIRTPIASIGPIVDEKLQQHGFTVTVRPQSSFHLKPLVRAIMAWRWCVREASGHPGRRAIHGMGGGDKCLLPAGWQADAGARAGPCVGLYGFPPS